jgi:hypothetical protein
MGVVKDFKLSPKKFEEVDGEGICDEVEELLLGS